MAPPAPTPMSPKSPKSPKSPTPSRLSSTLSIPSFKRQQSSQSLDLQVSPAPTSRSPQSPTPSRLSSTLSLPPFIHKQSSRSVLSKASQTEKVAHNTTHSRAPTAPPATGARVVPPTSTWNTPEHRVRYEDVRPEPKYASDVRAGLQALQAASKVFDTMQEVMDKQKPEIKRYSRVQRTAGIIRSLQDTGRKAVSSARELACSYRDFALLQSARLGRAPRVGWRRRRRLENDAQLEPLRRRIEKAIKGLKGLVEALTQGLQKLGTELDSIHKLNDDVKRWRSFLTGITGLLKGLAFLCNITSVALAVAGPYAEVGMFVEAAGDLALYAANYISSSDMEDVDVSREQVEQAVKILTAELPSQVRKASEQLDGQIHCVERLLARVDDVQASCYITRCEAKRAEKEWATEARVLAESKSAASEKNSKLVKR